MIAANRVADELRRHRAGRPWLDRTTLGSARAVGDDLDGVLSVGHRTWPATYEPIAGPDYVAMGLAKWWTADVVTALDPPGPHPRGRRRRRVVGMATFGPQDDAFVLWKLYVLPEPPRPGHRVAPAGAPSSSGRSELEHPRSRLSYIEGNQQAARFYAGTGFVETHRETPGSGPARRVCGWSAS